MHLVFDGIGEAEHPRAAQAGDGMQHFELTSSGMEVESLHIPFDGIQPFRLKEKLVAILIRKAHDLIFDGGGSSARPCRGWFRRTSGRGGCFRG